MNKIKVAFSGFWKDFCISDNIFINILKKYFEIELVYGKPEETDALFYTNFSKDFYKYKCVRIFVTGENLVPDFNLCDYAIGFEELHLGDRYLRCPLPYWNYREDVIAAENRKEVIFEEWKKKKFCAAVISNGDYTEDFRNELLRTLINAGKIDSGGRYLNNIEEKNGVANKFSFLNQYRFSLALENCQHNGYCTEKIYQSFAAGNIPIYWGDPHVENWINEKAFINCNSFADPKEAIDYIISIALDDKKCCEMLREPLCIENQLCMKDYDFMLEDWLLHIFVQSHCNWYRRARNGSIVLYEEKIVTGIEAEKSRFKLLGYKRRG